MVKKLLLLQLLIIAVLSTDARNFSDTPAKGTEKFRTSWGFGFKAGLNFGDFRIKDKAYPNIKYSTTMRPGAQIGFVTEATMKNRFYFQPSLYLSYRRTDSEEYSAMGDIQQTIEREYSYMYIELPVMLAYEIPIPRGGVRFMVGAYMAYGVWSKIGIVNITYNEKTEEYSRDYKERDMFLLDGYTSPYYRADAGLSFAIEVKISKFRAGVAYNLGLVNYAYQAYWVGMNDKKFIQQNRSIQILFGALF